MFTEDLSVFYGADDPGVVSALYDGATTIYGNLNNSYIEANTGVAGRNPVFDCPASSVAAAPVGKTLVVSGVTYVIRNIEPQDDGAWVLLQLEKQ